MTAPNGVFTAAPMRVDPAWIDYNGHLNMAWYNVLFDRCVDEALAAIGMDPDTIAETGTSLFTLEAHVSYLQELFAGDTVRVTWRVLDYDAKRIHAFQELFHAEQDVLSATSEILSLHVDTKARKACPIRQPVLDRLAAMHEAQAALPAPARAGRRIGIVRKPG